MNIIVTGDLYLTEPNIKSININGLHKSFSEELCTVIQKADFSITNYESAVHISDKLKGISKTGPVLSTSPDAMKIVREMGFDCVTLANNHIRDLGGQGIENALEVAQQNGIETVGAARTKEAAQRPLYIEIDGVKLAIINFCENEFSTLARPNEPQANGYNLVDVFYQIKEAKSLADFVLLIVHAGHEEYPLPSPRMKRDFRLFVDAGANAVVCHHAHCYTGYEVYHEAPIFYGLGNFVFEGDSSELSIWNYGYMLELSLTKENGQISPSFVLHPYKQGVKGDPVLLHNLGKEEAVEFAQEIEKKNGIIADDEELTKAFAMLVKRNRLRKHILSPYRGRIAQALNARGLLPSFISRKKELLLMNVLRCEAHRDTVSSNLEQIYYDFTSKES